MQQVGGLVDVETADQSVLVGETLGDLAVEGAPCAHPVLPCRLELGVGASSDVVRGGHRMDSRLIASVQRGQALELLRPGLRLGGGPDDLSWVVNAYILLFGGFLLLGGRLADVLGRCRMYIAGLVIFSAASLAGGLAQSAPWLVIARGAQGLGAALVSPAALALLMTLFVEGSGRTKALGVWAALGGSGGAAGATSAGR